MKPRVLFVGRGPYQLPLDPGLARRFEALSKELEWRQLASRAATSRESDPRFVLIRPFPFGPLNGLIWHAAVPFRVARELRQFHPDAVIVQGAQETALALLGRALARSRAAVVLDVQGDWRSATRLYGSRLRRLLDPLADLMAHVAVRRADGVRTITPYTTGLVREQGVEPLAEFPTYMDFASFTGRSPQPVPERPAALFVGVLERYKAVDVLADAWRDVARRVPGARLELVGSGTLEPVVRSLLADCPESVTWHPSLTANELARRLDEATVLVLPSRSEGMGRVVIEAFCRARGVVGSRVGGIPDLVRDGENGLLVAPGDAVALADTLARVLADSTLAERLSAGAAAAAPGWVVTPEHFARRVRALVDGVVGRGAKENA